LADSSTGRISGDREAGFTVCVGSDLIGWVLIGRSWASREPKSSWENVTGVGAERSCSDCPGVEAADVERKTVIPPVNASSSRIRSSFFACMSAKRISRSWFRRSIALFSASSASTSCRLRSLDDWAARRLRRTRSTRRCSFSSSVFARFLESGLAE
jgi:hypothetical protein